LVGSLAVWLGGWQFGALVTRVVGRLLLWLFGWSFARIVGRFGFVFDWLVDLSLRRLLLVWGVDWSFFWFIVRQVDRLVVWLDGWSFCW